MLPIFRKLARWTQRRRKEDELLEELEFHLAIEADERRDEGLSEEEATYAARRDLGNITLVREETRALWTWTLLEQLAQDMRYAFRMMRKHRTFTALAALSLALGIGANTAIYSLMDAILMRPLPVADPGSLVILNWHSKPFLSGSRAVNGREFVLHSIDGDVQSDETGSTATIFPFAAFEQLQTAAAPVLSSLFGYFAAGDLNVMAGGAAEVATGEYVTGDFFHGLGVVPAAGRVLARDDDRAGAPPVAVASTAYSVRRFGGAASAAGQSILINNVAFTIVGVAPPEFFGVDPGSVPDVFLPLQTMRLLDPDAPPRFAGPNYYWLEMMGRLRPGVSRASAQAVLEAPFAQWVASTASNDRERANLPRLRLADGAGGLDTLRSQYAQPLYVLWAMVGLILAIACANTASLLLARASARTREMAVRISIGAGRFRVIRQLLTESVLLSALSGAIGVFIAFAGVRLLTRLLANGRETFTLHAELNWQVLAVTLGLTLVCGLLFGLAPALQLARPAQMPSLKTAAVTSRRARFGRGMARPSLTQALVVVQIAISVLLLVAAGLFVRTLTNLESIPLGFNRDNVLLFEVNAPQAGYPEDSVPEFYAGLRRALSAMPGVHSATLSHASLIRAGRAYPVTVGGVQARGHRILQAGPEFFSTMEIPLLRGRGFDERDRQGSVPVAVVSESFARAYFGTADPIGQRIQVGGSSPLEPEIVGIAATAKYGDLRQTIPPVVYLSYAQVPASQLRQMVFALRTTGDPLRYVSAVRARVHDADPRVPVTNIKTLADDIDQTINQEIVFARLCTAFAMLALLTACVGLYGTMVHAVARRTRELGIRMALGARRRLVVWTVLREVWMLGALGVIIGVPAALAMSRLVESFLYGTRPNDPAAVALAVATLLLAALAASYGPARRASRVDPIIALRDE